MAKKCKTTIAQCPTITILDPYHGDITQSTRVTITGYGFGSSADDIISIYPGPMTKQYAWTLVQWVSSTCIIVQSTPLPAAIFKWDVGREKFVQPIDLTIVTRDGGKSKSTMKWVWTLNQPEYSFVVAAPALPVVKAGDETKDAKKRRNWETAQSQGRLSSLDHL